jgi:two-component system, LytTR family, response regulator
MILSCVIIEDEPLAADKLEGFISQTPFLKLSASFDNALDGLAFINGAQVDILFLDIQMEKLTGLQLLESLTKKPYVIITSAYSEYAIKGFDLQVSDYLLKPYSFERFLTAVNKIYDDIILKKSNDNPGHIFIKTEYRIENIAIDEILYIEGMQSYLQVALPDKKIITKQSFKSLITQLPQGKFIQVHKSWVVAVSKIESIERSRIKIANKLIPIGDTFKNAFYSAINNCSTK